MSKILGISLPPFIKIPEIRVPEGQQPLGRELASTLATLLIPEDLTHFSAKRSKQIEDHSKKYKKELGNLSNKTLERLLAIQKNSLSNPRNVAATFPSFLFILLFKGETEVASTNKKAELPTLGKIFFRLWKETQTINAFGPTHSKAEDSVNKFIAFNQALIAVTEERNVQVPHASLPYYKLPVPSFRLPPAPYGERIRKTIQQLADQSAVPYWSAVANELDSPSTQPEISTETSRSMLFAQTGVDFPSDPDNFSPELLKMMVARTRLPNSVKQWVDSLPSDPQAFSELDPAEVIEEALARPGLETSHPITEYIAAVAKNSVEPINQEALKCLEQLFPSTTDISRRRGLAQKVALGEQPVNLDEREQTELGFVFSNLSLSGLQEAVVSPTLTGTELLNLLKQAANATNSSEEQA